MNTYNPLLTALIESNNVTETENGATTYKSTLNNNVDFFAMGSALRTQSEDRILQMFIKAFNEDRLLALKNLFHIRNIRGGQGERRTFRIILKFLGDNYVDIVHKNLENIFHFGRADDVFHLFGTKSEQLALSFIKYKLECDLESQKHGGLVSPLGKWLPSNNTSSKNTKKLAEKISNYLGFNPRYYRKTLALLREASNVVEVKMSAREWSEINYRSVPSRANLIYKKAFSRNDGIRYNKFIEDVKSGKQKVNSSTLYPYDIVEKVLYNRDTSETLDILWDSLPNYMVDSERNILVMADVSGSMNGRPMATSISLAIYAAERNKGMFKDYFITYSETPILQKVVGNNIREKISCIQELVSYNTNLQAAFDLVLKTAITNNIDPKDMPSQIIVISDCEFDSSQNRGKTNHQTILEKYKAAGYNAPSLVYWNVNSRRNNVAALASNEGVLLVSGSSPSVFKTLLGGSSYTPIDQMLETLNQEMYTRVSI